MIVVEDIHKRFGEVHALSGVGFTAVDGKATALLGPNGAGKTTLMRTLVGLLARDRGMVSIDGIDPAVDPLGARRSVGLLERLSTREYLRYFGKINGMDKASIARRTDEVTGMLGLEDILDRPCRGFSQGQRIKVALARTLLHRPRNLLLDEPTRGLDVMSTRALRRALAALRAEGCCIILATHVMQEVTQLCDDVIVIAKGQTVAQGSPEDLCRQTGIASLEDAFVHLVGTEEGIAA